MQNNLQIFNYQEKEVRTIIIKDEPYWIAKDVCEILELKDVSMSLQRLDDDEKLIQKLFVSGQNRDVWLINEPGLYGLILTSNKPEAKLFKRWIKHELLPQVRKTGSYSAHNAKQDYKAKELEIRMQRELRLSEQVNISKAKELKDTAKTFMEVLSDISLQGLACEITKLITGKEIIPRPALECKYWSATEIVNEFLEKTGIKFSAQKLGRIANKNDLKVDEYGKYFLSKSEHSDKQVSHWKYNQKGKEKAFELLHSVN